MEKYKYGYLMDTFKITAPAVFFRHDYDNRNAELDIKTLVLKGTGDNEYDEPSFIKESDIIQEYDEYTWANVDELVNKLIERKYRSCVCDAERGKELRIRYISRACGSLTCHCRIPRRFGQIYATYKREFIEKKPSTNILLNAPLDVAINYVKNNKLDIDTETAKGILEYDSIFEQLGKAAEIKRKMED